MPSVTLFKDAFERVRVADPLEQAALFVQRYDGVGTDICPSASQLEFGLHSCRRRDSEALFNSLLIIILKSMRRASLRKSS
jgi:hypothetical protein